MKKYTFYGLEYKNKYKYPIVSVPKDWKELEIKVAHILSYCGCDVEIDKTVDIARGSTEFDVYAIVKDKYKATCICECKYWNHRVNQDVIDSFRSRLSDVGANLGIVISKVGFQSGCYEKIKFTNIKLFNFNEFLDFYEDDYLLGRAKEISKSSIDLHNYSDPSKDFYDDELNKKAPEVRDKIIKLMCKNDLFTRETLSMGFYENNPYMYFDDLIEFYQKEGLEFETYEDLCNYTIDRIKTNLKQLDDLFRKQIRLQSSKASHIDNIGI